MYTVESNHSTSPTDGDFPASVTWKTTHKVFLEIMEDVQAANHTSFRCGSCTKGFTGFLFLLVPLYPTSPQQSSGFFHGSSPCCFGVHFFFLAPNQLKVYIVLLVQPTDHTQVILLIFTASTFTFGWKENCHRVRKY